MRGAPPFEIEVDAGGAWRVAVGFLCLAAAASVVAWMAFRHGSSEAGLAAVGAASAIAVAAAASMACGTGGRLRYDGSGWWLGRPGVADEPGQVHAAVDTGGFLLLKFRPTGRRRAQWLPFTHTRGTAAWHLLRCAVYSARPGQAEPPPVRSLME